MEKGSILVILASVALCGCSTIGSVSPIGSDQYQINVAKHGGLTNWTAIKEMAITNATQYCISHGKQFEQVKVETSGVRGWTPQEVALTFRCS